MNSKLKIALGRIWESSYARKTFMTMLVAFVTFVLMLILPSEDIAFINELTQLIVAVIAGIFTLIMIALGFGNNPTDKNKF